MEILPGLDTFWVALFMTVVLLALLKLDQVFSLPGRRMSPFGVFLMIFLFWAIHISNWLTVWEPRPPKPPAVPERWWK